MIMETYVKFRCTEQEKAIINAMAMQGGVSASEFILNLIADQKQYYEQVEVFSVIKRSGVAVDRKSIGVYLVDKLGRASVYTTWKDISEKMEDHLSEFKRISNQHVYAEVNGFQIKAPSPLSDYVILEPSLWNKK